MKNIVLVKLNGGLGNQMFQYALAKVIAAKYSSEILLDMELFKLTEKKPGHTPRKYELGIFDLNDKEVSVRKLQYFEKITLLHKIKRELKLNYPKMCYEKNYSYDPKINKVKPPVYLRGFFQSYKYYSGYEKLVRDCFQFPGTRLDPVNREILNNINSKKSVAVHIRRGDYVKDKITNTIHGVCSVEYYQKALEIMMELDSNSVFYFFSDDMDWVEKNFKNIDRKKVFVRENENDSSWKDMLLMSKCDHNIIANSSFSWWAAWLNENKGKKVIAPKRWFEDPDKERYTYDLIPPQWLRL